MPRLNELLNGSTLDARSSKLESANGNAPRASSFELQPAGDSVCTTCHGTRFVRRDLPVDHPEFGQAVPCSCVQNENAHERQTRLQRYSNLGPLTRLTFENLIRRGRSADPRDQQRFQRCVADAEAFAQDPNGWLVLVGASGCGKTHIGAAIANRCIQHGVPALFVVVPDLLDHLRAAYRPGAEVSYDQLFEQVRNASVLVLDDLGTQSSTAWAQEKLFQIINHRFNSRLPTVITTNVSLNKFDERLRTRLGDPSLAQPHADPIATVHILEERRPLDDLGVNMLRLPMVQQMTFESFDLHDARSARDQQLRENAWRETRRFAGEPERWMVLLGGRSRDRTHLAAAIANLRRSQGELPVFVQVTDFLDRLRRALSDDDGVEYDKIKQTTRNCPLLILDDLEIGVRSSEWVRGELYQLLNPRCLGGLPTVMTTPHTLNQLLHGSGWERLARLLVDPSFCSEIIVGEMLPEDEVVAAKPKAARRRAAS